MNASFLTSQEISLLSSPHHLQVQVQVQVQVNSQVQVQVQVQVHDVHL